MYKKGKKVEAPIGPGCDFHGYGEEIRRQLALLMPKGEKKGVKILDVGTGYGMNAEFLAHQLPKGAKKIWSIDPSEEVLENARKKVKESIPELAADIEFVTGSAEKISFEDGFFDAVVNVMVLHHIEHLEDSLREMARVTKSGGKLILIDYAPEAHKLDWSNPHYESDFFRPEQVRDLLKKMGLETGVQSFGLWYIVEASKS